MSAGIDRVVIMGIKELCKLGKSFAKSETGQEISRNIDSAFNKVGENIKNTGDTINLAREKRLYEKAKEGNPEDIYKLARYLEIEKYKLNNAVELYIIAGKMGHYNSQKEAARLKTQIELFGENNNFNTVKKVPINNEAKGINKSNIGVSHKTIDEKYNDYGFDKNSHDKNECYNENDYVSFLIKNVPIGYYILDEEFSTSGDLLFFVDEKVRYDKYSHLIGRQHWKNQKLVEEFIYDYSDMTDDEYSI